MANQPNNMTHMAHARLYPWQQFATRDVRAEKVTALDTLSGDDYVRGLIVCLASQERGETSLVTSYVRRFTFRS
jgi:hypothetical protein